MKPLYNHTSIETSYMCNDYPYGSMRCRIRFWLESDIKRGFKFCMQTEDPKKLIWNKPKKSTYSLLAGCMFLDEKGHCTWEGLTEYSKAAEVLSFITKFPEADLSRLKVWCKQKEAYCNLRAQGKLQWRINNVVQEATEEELQASVVEAAAWKECVEKLG